MDSLVSAFNNRDLRSIISLLNNGIDPNYFDSREDTFLIKVLNDRDYAYNKDLIKCLINAGADVNRPGFYQRTGKKFSPLCIAILVCSYEVVQILVDSGADLTPACANPGSCIATGCSPFHIAAQDSATMNLVKLLLDRRVNIHSFCQDAGTVLQLMVFLKEVQLIKRIFEYGIDTNLTYRIDNSFETVLHTAVKFDRHDAVQLILEYEVTDVNIVDKDNIHSVLHLAVSCNAVNSIDRLLEANPDVNIIIKKEQLAVTIYTCDESKVKEKLKTHLCKLLAADCHLHEDNVLCLIDSKYCSLYRKCHKQVRLMKRTFISPGSHLSFYDLICRDYKSLVLHLETLKDPNILDFPIHLRFPLYADIIEFKVKKASKLLKLRNEVHIALVTLFGKHLLSLINPQVFNFCKEKVLSYFRDTDLLYLRHLREPEEKLSNEDDRI